MLRALLFGVLTLGAARLTLMLARAPAALDALGGEAAGPFDEQSFQPLVDALAELATPGAPVYIVASDPAAFGWIRYLAYPRRVEWLPAVGHDALQGLPAGTSYVVLPLARVADDASATLRARSGAAQVERLLARDGAFALYRVRR
jgi:hypothetical protein